jgi:hypothetical protein
MNYKGFNGSVELTDTGLIIHRQGVLSFTMLGIKGDKAIPFSSITAVQFRAAGIFINGFIQFAVKGNIESGSGFFDAAKDENTVIFQSKSQRDFEELRGIVERKLAEGNSSAATSYSTADEIRKLAALRDQGDSHCGRI